MMMMKAHAKIYKKLVKAFRGDYVDIYIKKH